MSKAYKLYTYGKYADRTLKKRYVAAAIASVTVPTLVSIHEYIRKDDIMTNNIEYLNEKTSKLRSNDINLYQVNYIDLVVLALRMQQLQTYFLFGNSKIYKKTLEDDDVINILRKFLLLFQNSYKKDVVFDVDLSPDDQPEVIYPTFGEHVQNKITDMIAYFIYKSTYGSLEIMTTTKENNQLMIDKITKGGIMGCTFNLACKQGFLSKYAIQFLDVLGKNEHSHLNMLPWQDTIINLGIFQTDDARAAVCRLITRMFSNDSINKSVLSGLNHVYLSVLLQKIFDELNGTDEMRDWAAIGLQLARTCYDPQSQKHKRNKKKLQNKQDENIDFDHFKKFFVLCVVPVFYCLAKFKLKNVPISLAGVVRGASSCIIPNVLFLESELGVNPHSQNIVIGCQWLVAVTHATLLLQGYQIMIVPYLFAMLIYGRSINVFN
ncbi:hypothetical protein AKO1_012730 [Acrasis kona]|uniref:Uncharacterized protein n=1 Tax=Acrasis kona TaxID=1008807 RepID=A0AAW2YWB7_9EUKA